MSLADELPIPRTATFGAWLELTKPRIVSLVLFTGLPALLLAAHGWPPAAVTWGALVGIALSAASAASFNHYFDRDIDALMRRTRTRPLPSGALPPIAAVALGLVLGALAMGVLVASTLVVAPLAGLGPLYTVSAAVLGALFVLGAERLRRRPSVPHAQGLFRYSILYLFVLFLVMSVDALVTVLRARA